MSGGIVPALKSLLNETVHFFNLNKFKNPFEKLCVIVIVIEEAMLLIN
jgi:hypothetical protein